ncbi:MAG TPA: putative 2-dehydropantoate 2-reductase [Pontiella sp.]
MSNLPSIAIVGTGAVGGFYGALLQRAGFTVHYLLHSDYEYVCKYGLTIESSYGDFTLPIVNAYNDPKKMPRCDVVIVALKTTANHILKDVLPHLIHENSLMLTLQNGLGSEETISLITGSKNIYGGLCFLCSNKVGPGHIRHLDYGLITIGEYRSDKQPGGITPKLEKLGNTLQSADIPIRLENDLMLARWKKLVWNIPFNGLSVLRNELTDRLIGNPETRALCRTLMEEVATASAVCSRPIGSGFIEKMLQDTERMKPYAPSMKLDFERGHIMEVESIYGNPLQVAKACGVSMPETEKLYQKLQHLNSNI